MDSKKVTALLKKYWEGTTKLEDEKELKTHFLHAPDHAEMDSLYFDYLNKKNDINSLDDGFDEEILSQIRTKEHNNNERKYNLKYWYIAATLALVISAGIIFKNEFTKVAQPINLVEIDTYDDPQKAFEETKRALLLISSKLNQTNEYASEFAKFEQSQQTVKQN